MFLNQFYIFKFLAIFLIALTGCNPFKEFKEDQAADQPAKEEAKASVQPKAITDQTSFDAPPSIEDTTSKEKKSRFKLVKSGYDARGNFIELYYVEGRFTEPALYLLLPPKPEKGYHARYIFSSLEGVTMPRDATGGFENANSWTNVVADLWIDDQGKKSIRIWENMTPRQLISM